MALYHHVENCVSVYKHNREFYELLDKSFIDEMRLGQGVERLGRPVLDIQVNIQKIWNFYIQREFK